MSNVKYESTIGGYSFLMNDSKTIEVWLDSSEEFPNSYIQVREGSIKSLKDFQTEISYWYMHNVG